MTELPLTGGGFGISTAKPPLEQRWWLQKGKVRHVFVAPPTHLCHICLFHMHMTHVSPQGAGAASTPVPGFFSSARGHPSSPSVL
jgi:hypothetical protein